MKYNTIRIDSLGVLPGCEYSYYGPLATSGPGVVGDRVVGHPGPGTDMSFEPVAIQQFKSASTSGRTGDKINPLGFTNYGTGRIEKRIYLLESPDESCDYYDKISLVYTWPIPWYPDQPAPYDRGYRVDRQELVGPICTKYCYIRNVVDDTSIPSVNLTHINRTEVDNALAEIQNSCLVNSLSTWDALTEAFEMRENIDTVKNVISDLSGISRRLRSGYNASQFRQFARMRPRDLVRSGSKFLRKLGERWMEYRYGIMPMVHSFQDIVRVSRKAMIQVNRASRVLTPSFTHQAIPSLPHKEVREDGTIRVSYTIRNIYISEHVAKLQHVAVNPLQTAWELIPYSFVVDWFVNVGDYICAHYSASLSSQTICCASIRTNVTESTYYVAPSSSTTKNPTCYDLCANGYGIPSSPAPKVVRYDSQNSLVQSIRENTYRRWVVPVPSYRLRFEPHLNWRRLVDSVVLSVNQLRRMRT